MCATTQQSSIPASSLAMVINSEKKNSGGNFTLRSKKTGKDFTYRISRNEFNGRWYTQVYIERQYLDFLHLGCYSNGAIKKKGVLVNTDTANGIAWLLRQVEKGDFDNLEKQADLFHTGSCLRCGKELTDAGSIEIGLGPVCRTI
jgi:hypothetical protein